MTTDLDAVIDRLETAIECGDLDGHAAEIARRLVALPDEHEAELERVAAAEMTPTEFAAAIETAPVPRMWGYPAADWNTLDRIRELREEEGLARREAEFRALAEQDYGVEHIAELTRVDIDEVRDRLDKE